MADIATPFVGPWYDPGYHFASGPPPHRRRSLVERLFFGPPNQHHGFIDDASCYYDEDQRQQQHREVHGRRPSDYFLWPRLIEAWRRSRYSPATGQLAPFRPSFDRARSGLSQVTNDKNEFKICLDVTHFKPDEVTVKTGNKYVTVEGRHEERQEDTRRDNPNSDDDDDVHTGSYISRHFIRKYLLPDGVLPETVTSSLSSDGVLSVTAPKRGALHDFHVVERHVPVTLTSEKALTKEDESSKHERVRRNEDGVEQEVDDLADSVAGGSCGIA